jgi:hypothetical protein
MTMKKNDKTKELVLEQLRKTPIREAACQKVGISRMTLDRWKQDDPAFAAAVDEALAAGKGLVNDVAESSLIGAVKDRSLPATFYWLRHHHPDYADKLEIKHALQDENLTPEQEALVREAMRLASASEATLINGNEKKYENNNSDGNGQPGGIPADGPAESKSGEQQKPDPSGTRGGDDKGPEGEGGDR